MAIIGGVALAATAIGVTVMTAGSNFSHPFLLLIFSAAAPATAAAIGVAGGMVAGVGISSAVHGAVAHYKGQKINPRDYGIDLGIGAITGMAAGGIAIAGGLAAATVGASAASAYHV